MVYTDRVHLVADTLGELHSFANTIGLKRCWFEKVKRHPHYDIKGQHVIDAIESGAEVVSSRRILEVSKKLITDSSPHYMKAVDTNHGRWMPCPKCNEGWINGHRCGFCHSTGFIRPGEQLKFQLD